MSIDLSGLSPKELASLISQAQKRQTVIAKRTPITKVRSRILKFAKSEGYSLEELFGTAGAAAPTRGRGARKPAPPPAASWARSRRNTAIRPTARKPGAAAASSRAG